MSREVNGILRPARGGIYVDATVGLGGHASHILGEMGGRGLLIGIDRDEEALKVAQAALQAHGNVKLRHARFSELEAVLDGLGVEKIDGVLFDLGVSMLQLKKAERGFSFMSEELLDMRMDKTQRLSAREVVGRYPEKELERILREYGEERFARRIARAIAVARQKRPVRTCRELADIVKKVSHGGGRERIHPATRTFQALRIEVNDELGELRTGIGSSLNRLSPGGRLAVISYHSLEDRIVKHSLKDAERAGAAVILTKKPLRPGPEELRENPSARSAKLRGAEKA